MDSRASAERLYPTVLIVGMHRSGTSAICRLLDDAGVDFGNDLIPPGADNPLGFWEDRQLIALNNRLLGSEQAWMHVALSPPNQNTNWSTDAQHFLTELKTKDPDETSALGLKDPRLCRTLDHWLPLLSRHRVMFVVRHPLSVAHSLNKRDGLSVEYALALWFVYNYEALRSLQESAIEFCTVNYERLMAPQSTEFDRIQHYLGLEQINDTLLESKLQHQQFTESDFDENNFIEALTDKLWTHISSSNIPNYRDFSAAYETLICLYQPLRKLHDKFEEALNYERHLEKDIERLKEDVAQSDKNHRSATEYVSHLEKDITELRSAITNERERKQELENQITELTCLSQNREHQLAEKDKETRHLLAESRQVIDDHKQTNDVLKNALETERQRGRERERQLAEKDQEAARLLADYRDMQTIRWQVDELLQEVYRCRSWRWTAPLRLLRNRLVWIVRKLLAWPRWMASYSRTRLSNVKAKAFISSTQNAAAMQNLMDNRSREKYWNPFPEVDAAELPDIGLSVVLFNNGQWLNTFMASLLAQDYPLHRIHLIFVDNSSTDDTPQTLAQVQHDHQAEFASLRTVHRPNAGFGCGHDYAIRQLAGLDYVLVSNVDLEFQQNAIVQAVATAHTDTGVASWELRQSPYEHPKYVDPVTLQVNWSSHACILISRNAYLAIGGYEKRIFMYGEDVELSYRFRREGYQLKYVPRAVVFHHTYESQDQIKPMQFSGSTAANLFIRCRYGNAIDVLVGYFLAAVLVLRGGGFAGSRKLVWKALPITLATSMAFLTTRKPTEAAFPFRGFDYDLCREGAFWESDRNILEEPENLPLVTVVTRTVAGREALLNQAIMSVMNQCYPKVEHVITEDGGTSTEALCRQTDALTPASYRIRHLACPKKGRSHAANCALEVASGDYIVILDDDDLLLPDHIETLVTEIKRSDSNAAYALAWDTPVQYFDIERSYYTERAHVTYPLFYQEFDRKVLFHHNFLPIQSVMFCSSLLQDSVRFDEDLDQLEDWVFWKRLSKNADFRFVPKTTSLYKTPVSASDNFKRKKALDKAYNIASRRPED